MWAQKQKQGFTIIEVILFLAVTGLILSGVFIAVSGSINRERYNSSVKSLLDYLKGQYSDVDNVQNNRSEVLSGCSGVNRGTSDCTIIGRFIQSNQDASKITSYSVIATTDIAKIDIRNQTDAQVFGAMNLAKVSNDTVEYPLEWQTSLVNTKAVGPSSAPFTMLILRSPVSNVMRTFVTSRVENDIAAVLNAPSQDLSLCVDSKNLVNYRTGVLIRSGGVNSSSVEFLPADGCEQK